MLRTISELIITTEEYDGNHGNKIIKFSARSPVTGKFVPELVILGEQADLLELVDRLKHRIEEAFR